MLACLRPAAWAHDFALPNGAKVTGDIIGAVSDAVIVQTADRRQVQLPVGTLAAADSEVFYQWCRQNQKYRFVIACEPRIAGPQKKNAGLKNGSGQSLDGYMQDWVYKVTVRNNSAFSLPAASMEVQTWLDQSGRNEPAAYKTPTVVQLPALKMGASHSFDTPPIAVATFRPPKGNSFTGGNNMEHKNRTGGVSATVKIKNETVWLHESDARLLYLGNVAEKPGIQFAPQKSARPYSGPPETFPKYLRENSDGKIRVNGPLK